MNLHPTLEVFVNWLLNQSLQAGVLVLLVLFVQGVFRRQLTAHWRFALWWLVLLLLLMPFRPQSAFSLFNYCRAYVVLDGPRYPVPVASVPSVAPAATGLPLDVPPQPGFDPGAAPAEKSAEVQADPAGAQASGTGPPTAKLAEIATGVPGARTLDFDDLLLPGLAALWLLGALVLGGYVLQQALRFQRHLARSVRPVEDAALALLDDCRRELGMRRRVELLETDAVKSPALFGLFRLRLLLPTGLTARFSREQLRFIFLHELAHVKRGDLWLNWLVTALQIMHWFNPLLWLGFARLRADRELACDELALLHAGEGVGKAYGQTIIKLLEGFSRPAAIPGLVGIVEDAKQMQRRIRMIARFKKPSRWSALAVLLVAALGVVGLTNATTPSRPEPNTELETAQPRLEARQVTAATAAATTRAQTPAVASPDHARFVRFRVVDAASAEPLFGVRVQVRDQFDQLTATDGTCLLPVPEITTPDFSLRVTISRDGYVAEYVSWSSSQKDEPADIPGQYMARMTKAITIGGIVRNERGEGIPRVRIVFSGPNPGGATSRQRTTIMGDFHEEYTDDSGRWLCMHVPARFEDLHYRLHHPEYLSVAFCSDKANQPYVNMEHLPNDSFLKTNAIMALKKGMVVSGTITDLAGKPVSGVRIAHSTNPRISPQWRESTFIITNGLDGRFQILNAPLGELKLVTQAGGFAPQMKLVSIAGPTNVVAFKLNPGHLLKGRVVDESQNPLTNAVIALEDQGYGAYYWQSKVDTGGRFIWDSAPAEPATYFIRATASQWQRGVSLLANGEERLIILKSREPLPRVHVSGRAIDASTGRPIRSFVLDITEFHSSGGERTAKKSVVSETGEFSVILEGAWSAYKIKAEADGYMPYTIPRRPILKMPEALTFQLTKSALISGMVLLPNGGPASGAQVALRTPDKGVILGKRTLLWREQSFTVDTDDQGSFKFNPQPKAHAIVAVHNEGFAEVPVEVLERNQKVRLQPWGRIEGVVSIGAKPAAHEEVGLTPLFWHPDRRQITFYPGSYTTRADDIGGFILNDVPPGEWKLCRMIKRGTGATYSHGIPIVIQPGQNTRVNLGGNGRTVVGRIVSEDASRPIDWQAVHHVVQLSVPHPKTSTFGITNKSGVVVPSSQYWVSEEGRETQRRHTYYAFSIGQDGSIQTDDVPAGNYELLLDIIQEKSGGPHPLGNRIASLRREVVIPNSGNGPFDLGQLAVAIARDLKVGEAAPVFEARDVNGKPLKLSDFRGKYVLLDFWATWCGPCIEKIPRLKAVHDVFGKDDRFAMISLSLDQEADAPRQFARKNKLDWIQGFLGEWSKTSLPKDYGVSGLPALFLIGPDGKIVARDLQGESIKAAVEKALAAK